MKQQNNSRQLLLNQAMELFQKNGYENTGVRDICAAAGLSNGSFYHFFKSKRDILASLISTDAPVYDILDDMDTKALDPQKYLTEYFISYAQYWSDIGWSLASDIYRFYSQMFLAEGSGPEHIHAYSTVATFIEAAQRAGTMRNDISPIDASEFLFITTQGIVYDWILHEGSYVQIDRARKYVPRLLESLIIK